MTLGPGFEQSVAVLDAGKHLHSSLIFADMAGAQQREEQCHAL
jgi:hypothetical protein